MAEFFDARKLRYEIHILDDRRWQIKEAMEDGRELLGRPFGRLDFEETERAVIDRAVELLGQGKVHAVRVVRERVRPDGYVTQREIFYREATGKVEQPLTVSRYEGPPAFCTTSEDLSRRPSCQIIGVVLRSFLDRHTITALELLHYHGYLRRISENIIVIQGSVQQIANLQVKAQGGQLRARTDAIMALLNKVEKDAREALAERGVPQVDEADFAGFAHQLAKLYPGDRYRYFMYFALAKHFRGTSYLAKLDSLLTILAGQDLSPTDTGLLDEMVAGCLDHPALVTDILGHQPNLAAALESLVALAAGEEGSGDTTVQMLRRVFGFRQLVHSTDTIWSRVLREIERGKPLSRDNEKAEWGTLVRTRESLAQKCPESYKPLLMAAFKERASRLRNARLQ